MRRGDGRRIAIGDGRGQRRIGGDCIQRIGIEHERNLPSDGSRCQCPRGGSGSESGAADERIDVRVQQFVRCTQHQFGLAQIDGRVGCREKADRYLASSGVERCAAREERCAHHPFGTADDREFAKSPFMDVASPPAQRGRKR